MPMPIHLWLGTISFFPTADNNNSPLISSEQQASQEQGFSLTLSADGATLAVGVPGYNEDNGAVSVWERKGNLNSPWVETSRLTGYGNTGNAAIGIYVAISSDGRVIYAGVSCNLSEI